MKTKFIFPVFIIGVLACTLVLISPATALASDYYYCTEGSSYVYLGDPIEKVEQLCGQPSSKSIEMRRQSTESSELITRWVYNRHTSRATNAGYSIVVSHTQMNVDFENNIVKAITIGRQTVVSTDFCGKSKTIAVGDSQFRVTTACGQPSYKQQYHPKKKPSAPQAITVYNYDSFTGTTTMKFRQSKLVKIEP